MMQVHSGISLGPLVPGDERKSRSKRQKACLNCYRMKIKCHRNDPTEICQRCGLLSVECVTPKRVLGRALGSKNKKTLLKEGVITRDELEKLNNKKRRRSNSSLDDFRPATPQSSVGSITQTTPTTYQDEMPVAKKQFSKESRDNLDANTLPAPFKMFGTSYQPRPPELFTSKSNKFNYNELISVFQSCSFVMDPTFASDLVKQGLETLFHMDELPSEQPQGVFTRVDEPKLDVGAKYSNYDVIHIGLIEIEEAKTLFNAYFDEINPFLRVLDRDLHTFEYVRTHSSFLFCVILETAAAYCLNPSKSESLFRRLRRQTDWLHVQVAEFGFKSVEICQAYQLRSAWIRLPQSTDEERIWQFLGTALMMAVELRLDAPVPYCATYRLTPDDSPELRQRLIRNSQRTWLCLYNRDRAIASMAGRRTVLPEGPLTSSAFLSTWHQQPFATSDDASTAAAVALRKQIYVTQLSILAEAEAGADFDTIHRTVEQDMDRWREAWQPEIAPEAYEYLHMTVQCTSFFLVATPYDRLLRENQLQGHARDRLMMLGLQVCQGAVMFLNGKNAAYQDGGRRMFAPTVRLSLIMYAAFSSIKLLEVSETQPRSLPTYSTPEEYQRAQHDRGIGLQVDLFHLAVLAQLGFEMVQLGGHVHNSRSAATHFGRQLLMAARSVALQKVAEGLEWSQMNNVVSVLSTNLGTSPAADAPLADFVPAPSPFTDGTDYTSHFVQSLVSMEELGLQNIDFSSLEVPVNVTGTIIEPWQYSL